MKEENEVSIKYKIKWKDIYIFNKWNNRKNKYYYLPVIFLPLISTLVNHPEKITNADLIKLLAYIIIGFLLYAFIIICIQRSILIGTLRILKRDNLFGEEREFIISNKSIISKRQDTILDISIEELYKIVVRKNYIYLMLSKKNGIILPKREVVENQIFDFFDLHKTQKRISSTLKIT